MLLSTVLFDWEVEAGLTPRLRDLRRMVVAFPMDVGPSGRDEDEVDDMA